MPIVFRSLLILNLLAAALPARAAEASCPQLDYALQAPPLVSDERLIISADQGDIEQNGFSTLAGAVKLQQGDKEFNASAVSFDSAQRRIEIRAESLFRNRDLIIKSRSASFDLNAESGVFSGTEFTLPAGGARGSAETLTLMASGQAKVEDMSYTTCPPESRAWALEASKLTLDHQEGLGSARGATLRFLGAPVFYLPYFQFPIDDRRRTGLLFPTVGDSDNTGFDVRWPLYLNLAPNYDATLTPRYMTRRGAQIGSDFRYLFNASRGSINYDLLPKDQVTQSARSFFELSHAQLLTPRLSLAAHYANVTDPTYFEELGDALYDASLTHLDRSLQLSYQAPAAYQIALLLQDYQTVASNIARADEPYRRLPQLSLHARTKNSRYNTRLDFAGEYVNFVRDNSVQGQRINLVPSLRAEVEQAAWFYALQGDYRYTAYQLSGAAAGQPETPSRDLPQLSAETGLRFERMTQGGNLQTLEPRLLYLYTPFADQTLLPVFDSGEPDFDFTQLFARNRFSGEDRVSDANHLAMAATSRLLDPETGVAKWSLSVGQIFRFQPTRVAAAGGAAPDRGATDFIASFEHNLSRTWSGGMTVQWSPDEGKFNRSALALRYRDAERRLDLAYRYRQSILEQADVTASTPLFSNWRAAGRTRYSLRDRQALDSLIGLEYETCCWALRGSYRRFIANTAGEFNRGIYLQLELKGLTRIGAGFEGLLPAAQSVDSRR